MAKLYFIVLRKKSLKNLLIMVFLISMAICAVYFLSESGSFFDVSAIFSSGIGPVDPNISKDGGKLAIIIDDFGSSRNGVQEMMSTNAHLTFAIMPFCRYSEKDAEEAHEKGYEVIVHLPMEPNYGRKSWLGPKPILASMEISEVQRIVIDSFESIPHAVGANIHMGSKASGDKSIISAVLEVLKERDLYFVDSRTADHPVAKKIADKKGVICYDRDVFLDGQQSKGFVKQRLNEAGRIALKKGKAIAIGHVGIEGGKTTAEAIGEMIPEFRNQNIQLVFVSELGK